MGWNKPELVSPPSSPQHLGVRDPGAQPAGPSGGPQASGPLCWKLQLLPSQGGFAAVINLGLLRGGVVPGCPRCHRKGTHRRETGD